jgi:hypothetical protein
MEETNQTTTPTNPTPPPISPTNKKSNAIWWTLGISCLVFIVAAIIIIFLIFGWLMPQKSTTNQKTSTDTEETKPKNNTEDKKIQQLEKEIKELEDLLDQQKETNTSDKESKDDPAINPVKPLGTIEGSLSYPSEQIPDLTVCAYNTADPSDEYCTTSLIDSPQYTAGRGYQLVVPPGDYYVYSYFIDKTHTAYYTEFVPCGLDISCPSHAYITVTVGDGDHLTGIDPVDWYM